MRSSYGKDYFVIKFNGALPVTLEVLEQTSFQRYHLKIGHKFMNTRSLKPLKVGFRYWANFSQTKEGMLSINMLKEKPAILQNELKFLEISSWDLIDSFSKNGVEFFKTWILDRLESTEVKSDFLMLTSMLLALNEGVFHLPFKINNRPFLLQYSFNEDILKENKINFYFAFDTLGAIKGEIKQEINLQVLYKKTKNLIENEMYNDKKTNVSISQNMLEPLWKGNDGLLDVKG